MKFLLRDFMFILFMLAFSPMIGAAQVLPYDIVYVRAPRPGGDTAASRIPEVFYPTRAEPGTDLMLLHPDGSEEVLVPGGADGAIMDPVLSFDGQWVYYARFPNVRDINFQRGNNGIPRQGADIWKIHVTTRELAQLTTQTWTPTPTIARWCSHQTANERDCVMLGYGVFNTGPAPLPGGKLMFTSSRNGLLSVEGFTFPNFQIFVLDEESGIVEQVGHLNLGSALHPTALTDGRVMFSSYEAQGLRDRRLWALWAMAPDGRQWEPLFSAFLPEFALHWQTQLSKGKVAVVGYYNLNNWGFGTLFGLDIFPINQPMAPGIIRFGDPLYSHASNPRIPYGYQASGVRYAQFSFSPVGLSSLTPFAHAMDNASDLVNEMRLGKVTQPSAAPNSHLLLVWASGPVNALMRPVNTPFPDAGLYLLANETPAYTPTDLVLIKNDPRYNEQQPRAVVPYQAIYGKAQPDTLPWLPNTGTTHAALPAGTPFGLIGTSSFYKRNTAPAVPLYNWQRQGSDAGTYASADIHSVRILLMEPQSHLSYLNGGGVAKRWWQTGTVNERLRVLGEIPLRKYQADGTPVLDVDGNPDTSFLAKIPADHVFTFQTLEANGSALNTSQTWHQLRPGEVRTDCGGCHAHAQVGTSFASTAAGQPGFLPTDLTQQAPTMVEYSDVRDILARTCATCTGLTPQQIADQFTLAFQSRISPLITEKTPLATEEDRRALRAWIDLGACVSLQPTATLQPTTPCREVNTRPTLHLQIVRSTPPSCPMGCVPESNGNAGLSIGAFSYQGAHVVSVTRSDQAGEFASAVVATAQPGIWHLPLASAGRAVFIVRVQDGLGIWTEKRLAAQW